MNKDKENTVILSQNDILSITSSSNHTDELPTIYDFLDKDLFTQFIQNKTKQTTQRIDAYAVLKHDNGIITLTIHHPFGNIESNYNDKLDIQISDVGKCNILFTNLVEKILSGWAIMPGTAQRTWYYSKYTIKDALISKSYNIEDSFNVIKLYIQDLDKFIGTTDDILSKEQNFDIKSINIGKIYADKNIYLLFCFDRKKGDSDVGAPRYIEQDIITPYVMFFSENYISVEKCKEIINDFITLYSLLTGKDEKFNRIFLQKYDCVSELFSADFIECKSENNKLFNRKYCMFSLGRNITTQLAKNCSCGGNEPYVLENDIFKNFFHHKNKEIYKLFFATRKMDKYQKFTTLYTCFEVVIRASKIIKNEMKRKTKKEREKWSTGAQIDYFMENYQDIKDFLNFIDKRILIGKYIQKIKQNRNNIMHGDLYKIQQDEIFICSLILELIVYFLLLQDLGIDKKRLMHYLFAYVDYNIIKNLMNENSTKIK